MAGKMSKARKRAEARAAAGSGRTGANTLMVPRAPRAAHQAGDPFESTFAGNYASRGSADRDWLRERLEAIPRVRDLIANEPLAASAVEQKLSLLVGDGWRFESAPDAAAFGIDPTSDEYEALCESIELVWRRWANDPLFRNDYEERLPFDLQLDLLTRQYVGAEGEGTAMLPFVDRDGFFGTSLQVIDPDRLAQPTGMADSDRQRGGVQYDERGRPVAYYVLDGHPYDVGLSALHRFSGRWVPRMTPGMPTDTRPFFLHVMRPKRAGQTRGISDFMASAGRLQFFRDLSEMEMRQFLINSMVVATYTSATTDPDMLAELLGAQDASKLLDLRDQFYDSSGISKMAGSRIIQTFPGDELKWNSDPRDTNAYVDVAAFMAIQCGAPIGLSYELMTRDFSKTTFTSARTAINDAFRMVRRERLVLRSFATRPTRLAVLQEAFETHQLALPARAPSIWDNPQAYLGGQEIGPGRELTDPTKDATGDRLEIENMSATVGDIAARRGQSLDEIIARGTRERRKLKRAGMSLGDLQAYVAADRQLATPQDKG